LERTPANIIDFAGFPGVRTLAGKLPGNFVLHGARHAGGAHG
jgi:hypothetical protein